MPCDINTPITAACVCMRRPPAAADTVRLKVPLGRAGCGLGTGCTDTPEDDEDDDDDAEEEEEES